MPHMRIPEAANLLGVSVDTIRRLVANGQLTGATDDNGRQTVLGVELARLAQDRAQQIPDPVGTRTSARNRLVGLVVAVRRGDVMSQVDLQCGPYRVTSLVSTESIDELQINPGSVSVAVIKATNVHLETP